jgi:hypothetical protein
VRWVSVSSDLPDRTPAGRSGSNRHDEPEVR